MKNTDKKYSEDAWDNRELGSTEEFVRKVSDEDTKKIDEKLGLQVISIRLQKSLIHDLKQFASENGLGYQPFMRQLLTKFINEEKMKRATRDDAKSNFG